MREEKQMPNYYAIIPADVRYDKNLKDKAKLLYGEISALSNQYGYCYATNKYFAELYDVSITTVSLLIKDLVDKGYLETEIIYKEGTKEILNRYLKIIKGGYLNNLKEGYLRKVKDNNININNININNNISSSLIDNNIDIYSYLQQNGFVLNPIHYEVISKWEDSDLTRYAIQKAVLNGKYNINYIDKIIYNWQKQNIKTLEQAKALDDEYEKAKEFKEKQKNEKRMTSGERMNQYFDELEEEERRKNGDKSS